MSRHDTDAEDPNDRRATEDVELDDLIHRVDLDGLVRLIDRRASAAEWAGVDRIRRRALTATKETGRQLWPAATLAEYRLALDGPAVWTASVLDDNSGRLTIGPLSEVAATNHTWTELAEHLDANATATYLAHERSIRGESIDSAALGHLPPVLDIPAAQQPWEPDYPASTYSADGAEHGEPPRTGIAEEVVIAAPDNDRVVDDIDVELAVRQLVETWTVQSTGRVEALCVEGGPLDALAALGVRSARITPVRAAEALAELAWAGASGGAHGRRRGMANGRYSMWWLLAAIGDLDWPPSNDAVTELLEELDWFRWDAHEPPSGWRLQLLVHNRVEHLSWVINARDDS